MGFMGSPSRWRTMPWMVAVFGILVIPLGLVHIFLVISQPLVAGALMCMEKKNTVKNPHPHNFYSVVRMEERKKIA